MTNSTPHEIGGLEPVPEGLEAYEYQLADAAFDMLTGRSTKSERERFHDLIDGYGIALTREALKDVNSCYEDTGSETFARSGLTEFLVDSKRHIVHNSHFRYAQVSKVEQLRHSIEKTKRRRLLGRIGIAGLVGLGSFGVATGLSQVTDLKAGGISVITALLVNRGVKARQLTKTIASASGRAVKQKGVGSLDRHDASAMQQIVNDVAHIEDPGERKRATYDLITERFHLKDAVSELWVELGPHMFVHADERKHAVDIGVGISVASLLAIYNLEVRETEKEKVDKA